MNEITRLFDPAGQGDAPTAENLLPLVYDELRVLLFKVANDTGDWKGSVGFTDSQGNPPKAIGVTLDREAKN